MRPVRECSIRAQARFFVTAAEVGLGVSMPGEVLGKSWTQSGVTHRDARVRQGKQKPC